MLTHLHYAKTFRVPIRFILLAFIGLAILNSSPTLGQRTTSQTGSNGQRSGAQQPRSDPRRGRRRSSPVLRSVNPMRRASVNPFDELESEVPSDRDFNLTFRPTNLDARAVATAQVIVRGQTLLVRVRARSVPLPSRFGVPRYALWVYMPNYDARVCIGDLPITPTSRNRGRSDSAYRFPLLPRNAVFGGLMLTVEPVIYNRSVVNEPLRPLLVAFTPEANAHYVARAGNTNNVGRTGGMQASATSRSQRQVTARRPRTTRNSRQRAATSRRSAGRTVRRRAR